MTELEKTESQTPKAPLISNKPFKQQMSDLLSTKLREPVEKKEEAKEIKEEVEDKPIQPVIDDSYYPEPDEDERPPVAPLESKTWQDHVAKNVQPIVITGMVGEEAKTFRVYTEDDLPSNFQFDSQLSMLKAQRAFNRLENQANKLRDEFVQQENYQKQQAANQAFLAQEEKDEAADLHWLQSRGIVPEFKYESDDPKFNDDPAVKEANEIHELYLKVNAEYAQRYNGTGRMYRISFRDAADKYYSRKYHSSRIEKPVEKSATEKERDNMARRSKSPQGGDAKELKGRYKARTFADVNRLIKQGKI